MTDLRKQQLESRRNERKRQEVVRKGAVDGNEVVAEAVRSLPSLNPALKAKAADEREKTAVKVGAGRARTLR